MFSSAPRSRLATLFIYLSLLLAISAPVFATEHALHQRHVNMKRIVKKRLAEIIPQGVGAAGRDPAAEPTSTPPVTVASSTTTSTSTSTSTSISTQSSATSVTSTSTSASSSTSGTTSTSSSSTSASTSASSTTSSSTTSTSSSTTSSTLQTSQTLNLVAPTDDTVVSTVHPTVTQTQAVQASNTSEADVQGNTSKTKSTTITVLIVVAASVGGVAILWTIFRKWKLGRSKKFDDRLQPIDWQPTTDEDVIPSHRRNTSGTSSFHSGAGHSNNGHRGAAGFEATSDYGYGNSNYGHGNSDYGHGSSDHGHGIPALNPLPDHDFTAGSNLAPIGGYADLARGPSPQPQMHETLVRGPSLHRAYDVGVPLHHQAGYGTQDAYNYNNGVRY